MKRKYIIHDEDGTSYNVEEIEEVKDAAEVEVPTKDDEANGLLPEEIEALKKLAAVADKLVGLVNVEEDAAAEDEDEDVIVDSADEDEDEDEDKVIDTCGKGRDSKASFGSIETNRTTLEDSIDEDSISETWNERYNKQLGGNK